MVKALSDNLLWFSGYVSNSYLYTGFDTPILFDVPSPSMVDELISHLSIDRLYVLFTHYHFDHIAGSKYLDGKIQPTFVLPRYFKPLLDGEIFPSFPPPREWFRGLLRVWRKQGFRFMSLRDIILSPMAGIPFTKAPLRLKRVEYIEDNFMGFKVINTPGHTPESTTYILEDYFAITGDTVLGWENKIFPNPFCRDRKSIEESYGKILSFEFSYLLPGHGEPVKR